MAAPTKQARVVVITKHTAPLDNQNRALSHPFHKPLTCAHGGVLTKAEEIMMNGVTEVLRKRNSSHVHGWSID